MDSDRAKQREWAIEMYGNPKEQKSWIAKLNSWFAIYEEMARHPTQTQATYTIYKVKERKDHEREVLNLPGIFLSEKTLETIAVHHDPH